MLKMMLKLMTQQQRQQASCGMAEMGSFSHASGMRMRQSRVMHRQAGFTLIELMVAVIIVAVLTAVAIGSYRFFADKKDLATAQQEVQNIAAELEKFKAKNFSYKGFDAGHLYVANYTAASGELALPLNVGVNEQKYTVRVLDLESGRPLTTVLDENGNETDASESVLGLNWLITATRTQQDGAAGQPNNYDLLLTSTGLRCQSRTNNAFSGFNASTHSKCSHIDSNSEVW